MILRLLLALTMVAMLALPAAWAACSNTSWLTLCKPASGDNTWSSNWNTNADTIDDALSGVTEVRPRLKGYTDAGKPTAGTAGRVIRLTDSNLQGVYVDDGSSTWNRVTPRRLVTTTASLNFVAWGGADCQTMTMAVAGAVDGAAVIFGIPNALASTADVLWSGYVSAADVVALRGCKLTAGASADPDAATVRAWVVLP